MIKNVVFDFGNVLIRFDPLYMTEKYVEDGDDARLVAEVVFDRAYWDRLDGGTISDAEVVCLARQRLPARLREGAEQVYYNWIYNIPEIEGMGDIVRALRSAGYRLFLLSNISEYFADHAGEFPILSEFERCIFSARAGHTKPNSDMYEYLCVQCGIQPNETLFIDDNFGNISAARDFGINTYLFDGDARRLKEYLEDTLEL